jgi:hypothetical protein
LPELLEALWPVACRSAGQTLRENSKHLLAALMLGGISHTNNCWPPWKDVPGLLQPFLIQALKDPRVLGRNFVRGALQHNLDHLMDQHGMREAIRASICRLQDGETPPPAEMDEAEIDKLRIEWGAAPYEDGQLGWKLFKRVAQQTAQLYKDHLFTPAPPKGMAPLLQPAGRQTFQFLIDWLKDRLWNAPSRAELAWVAQELCQHFHETEPTVHLLRGLD